MFCDTNNPDDTIKQAFGLKDKVGWKVRDARTKIRMQKNWEKQLLPILYRPFDLQWIFYNDAVIERTRREVMHNMTQQNIGLVTSRIVKGEAFRHCVATENITSGALLAPNTASSSYLFPLYLYPDEDLYNGGKSYQRQVNVRSDVLDALRSSYKKKTTPEQILFYIYAVLYSNIYRKRYEQFLKTDFPRIPFCKNYRLFASIASQGAKLTELHLMDSKILAKPVTKFEGKSDNLVDKVSFNEKERAVWINSNQYFGPVAADVWNYRIGGYQVMDKWLKDRKGRRLSLNGITHYCRIATAIAETIRIQKKIDSIYKDAEKDFIIMRQSSSKRA